MGLVRFLLRGAGLGIVALTCVTSLADERVRFNRDIRPLLSSKCYQCHGPDKHQRQADFRLDQFQADFSDRGIIVPGSPDDSELVLRITSDDPDYVMPPVDAKLELTDAEKQTLVSWIEQGAEFEGHWAYVPPQRHRTPQPNPTRHAPIRNPIDAFIQGELSSQSLTPSPEADRRTLIRRLTFDLWGLPPAPSEIHRFLNDGRPDAYERLVDRLLDSPRFGERMTLAWMDAARYGDTSVFHADGPRDMWPWRDWVLNAYNSNMPFDQFTLEQLAGDLLPNPTRAQMVATGFNRNHGTTDEGGAIDEEYRVEYIVDRVKTTSMIWLGLTMECAQCHEHKYDPISQQDYYRFFAFFNQTPEKGMQTRNGNAEPRVIVPDAQQDARLQAFHQGIERLQQRFEIASPSDEEIEAWVTLRLSAGAEPSLGTWHQLGPFPGQDVDEAFTKDFGPENKLDLKTKYGELEWTKRREWMDGQVISFAYSDPGSATYLYRTIQADEPSELDISLGSDDTVAVWLNRKQVFKEKANRGAAPDQASATLALVAGKNDLLIKVCNNTGPTGFYFKAKSSKLSPELEAAIRLAREQRTPAQHDAIAKHFKAKVWPKGKEILGEIAEQKKLREEFRNTIPTVMVMKDMAEPRMTFVLNRGNYAAPDKNQGVRPRTPGFLTQVSEGGVESRLGLARWLTADSHPLTARVTVNRYWTMLFGNGIVSTVADFGSQGAWPSHPELLDYLAREFVDSGWDIKRMIRQIVTSHTYRQSSAITAENLAKDPTNRYLARAPRLRLPAEFIRDNALAAAGLLVERVGGPGVRPYQPPGLWNEVSLSGDVRFQQDHGEKLYRRTMYTYWKRSAPQPAMMTFDVPTREKCVIRRQRTNTPLQALVTLNDDQYVEAARCLAERLLETQCSDDASRLTLAFELATGKQPDAKRQHLLLELLHGQHDRYTADPQAALALLSVGEADRNDTLQASEHAAWAIVASVILNLDETLNKE